MIVNELYDKWKNTSAILFCRLGTFLLLSPSPSRSLAFLTESSVGNATSLALLRDSLAFTCIRQAGQRTSEVARTFAMVDHVREMTAKKSC